MKISSKCFIWISKCCIAAGFREYKSLSYNVQGYPTARSHLTSNLKTVKSKNPIFQSKILVPNSFPAFINLFRTVYDMLIFPLIKNVSELQKLACQSAIKESSKVMVFI